MMIAFLKLKPVPEKRQAVLDILGVVKDRLQMARGCLESTIYRESDHEPMILYLEQWQFKDAMDQHIRSDVYNLGGDPESSTKGSRWMDRI